MNIKKLIFSPLFFILLLCQTSLVKGDDTTTGTETGTEEETTSASSTSNTLIWVTGTDSAGVTQTTQSIYTQSFRKQYSTVTSSVPTGTIGLGTISGSIGTVRVYSTTTIGGGYGFSNMNNFNGILTSMPNLFSAETVFLGVLLWFSLCGLMIL